MAKTLYHSELRKLGPVQVEVVHEARPSQYKGRPDYAVLRIAGEERSYACENESCARFFDDQQGASFTLVAEGTKDDATLCYVGQSAAAPEPEPEPRRATAKPPPRGKGRQQNAPPPRQNAPPPAQNTPAHAQNAPPPAQRAALPPAQPQVDPVLAAKRHAMKVANLFLISVAAGMQAKKAIEEQLQVVIADVHMEQLNRNILVQLEKDGFLNKMPVAPIQLRGPEPAAEAPAAAAQPSDNDGNAN